MSERPEIENAGIVWRHQPEEEVAVGLEQIVDRRTKELDWSTRWEILMSICAALLFVGVVLLRVAPSRDGFLNAVLAAAGVWAILALILLRRQIWRPESPRADAAAATGLEYYRRVLERRRDHLKNAWIWHGPLFMACLALIAIMTGRSFLGFERWRSVMPLLALLAGWTVFGVVLRLRQARELQREIDELERG